jgi:Asp-tRNA(Asn)/Glu-tRNA(Gln) amidotransferase A subunit family amidase
MRDEAMKRTIAHCAQALDTAQADEPGARRGDAREGARPDGEGSRVPEALRREALAQAIAFDVPQGGDAVVAASGPLAGIPISIKDLFDIAGEVTTPARSCCATTRRRCATRRRWSACAAPARS